MAALPGAREPALVDLRRLDARSLDALLEEAVEEWRRELDWDYRPSADLVRRFVRMQALLGYALMDGTQAVGYGYYVCEEHKGLIGDLYVRAGWRDAHNTLFLLAAMVDALVAMPFIRRIESQLILLGELPPERMPLNRYLRVHGRDFMLLDLDAAGGLRPVLDSGFVIEPWSDRRQEAAAQLIARAYRAHIDSQINDQYMSPAGARRFLSNIIQYPGCGSFFPAGSFLLSSRDSGDVLGLSLSSLIAFDTGHITQLCLDPALRGRGLGYELLRRSLCALAEACCRRTSLTVTTANRKAIELYERMGFRRHRHFDAYVWEKLR